MCNYRQPFDQVSAKKNFWVEKAGPQGRRLSLRPGLLEPSSSWVQCGDFCFKSELLGPLIRCPCLLAPPTLAHASIVRMPSSSPSTCLWLAGGSKNIILTGQSRAFTYEGGLPFASPSLLSIPSSSPHPSVLFLSPSFTPVSRLSFPSSSHSTTLNHHPLVHPAPP